MRTTFGTRLVLPLLTVAAALGASAESLVLYTRATPLEARTGVVEIRSVQEAIADIPVDCAGDPLRSFGCSTEQRFARVYGLDFALERREAQENAPQVEREDRGQAYLFLHVGREDLAAFDEELRRRLASLAADAFVDGFAGLTPGAEVFSRNARFSPEPSWSCFENGSRRTVGVYQRETAPGPDGKATIVKSGTTVYELGPVVDPLCVAGRALVRSTPPDEVRTMPSARALREETVRVGIVDGLPTIARTEDLVPLPEGVTYTVSDAPGVVRSASRHSDGSKIKASFVRDGVRIGAEVAPATFPAYVVATRGWLAEWTVEAVDRELGARPSGTLAPAVRIRTALAATLPPSPIDGEGRPIGAAAPETVEPAFEAEAYLDEIANRLDRAARLDIDALASAISADPAGLGTRGWILFVCRERSATFELLPTRASQEVVNAGELCAAIDRVLARAGAD